MQADYKYDTYIFTAVEADQNYLFDSFLYAYVFVYVSLSQTSAHQLFIH